jgi:hypothetical protein
MKFTSYLGMFKFAETINAIKKKIDKNMFPYNKDDFSASFKKRTNPAFFEWTAKKGKEPKGYFDYTVYPLEGVWDINEKAKESFNGKIDKNDLVFNLMIRQPDFVDEKYALMVIEQVKKSTPHEFLSKVKFEHISDGDSVQMLHIGPYDDEPASFQRMEEFAGKENLNRKSRVHREIYLSDVRKGKLEKLKTVLRFEVES